jgi:hypothetical protein
MNLFQLRRAVWLRRLSDASQSRFTLLKNHHRLGWLRPSRVSTPLPRPYRKRPKRRIISRTCPTPYGRRSWSSERALKQAESVRAAKPAVTPAKIEALSRSAREILHGSNRAIAKQALQSIVARVEVTDETIRILGENEQLSRLVASEGSDPEGSLNPAPGVRGYTQMAEREGFEPLIADR